MESDFTYEISCSVSLVLYVCSDSIAAKKFYY